MCCNQLALISPGRPEANAPMQRLVDESAIRVLLIGAAHFWNTFAS